MDSTPNLIDRSTCYVCGTNYLLRGIRFAQLIEIEDALEIRYVTHPKFPLDGPQPTCFNFVPLSACIFVCFYPCWIQNKTGDLRRYAHAPFAAELKGMTLE